MTGKAAPAKINLALVVGPVRPDGRHEVVTIVQRVELCDHVQLVPSDELEVGGFAEDTLVRNALVALGKAAGVEPRWRVRIEKNVPVAAGLGGGSSDAATALRLANESLPEPLPHDDLVGLAAALGADVPFFLAEGPQLGTGDGSELEPVDVPQAYAVVLLVLPDGEIKPSTASVYRAFDERDGAAGFEERRARLLDALRRRDLAALPPNDLVRSTLGDDLRDLGAVRADISGAGPAVYGLFAEHAVAAAAEERLRRRGRTWLTAPTW